MTSSRGIVIFAYNSTFDYVKIANVCAALTKRFTVYDPLSLKTADYFVPMLPVTLITDEFGALQADQRFFDNIIVHSTTGENKRTFRTTHDEGTKQVDWKNLSRADVYELSPYDQTLLLDCDYLLFNFKLLGIFNTEVEFACFSDVHDITGLDTFRNDRKLSPYSIPMLWATVIYFRKCEFSKSVFEMMQVIKENYPYYAKVYGFKAKPFRNDFALSIAHHALSGYGEASSSIPWKLNTLPSTADVIDVKIDGSLLYQYKDPSKRLYTGKSKSIDLHVMNKEIFTDDIVDGLIKYASGN